MKKITLLAVAFVALTAVSCKKDRTCACTSSTVNTFSGGSTSSTNDPTSTVYTKVKKSGVTCADNVSTTTGNGYTSVTTSKCSLS